MPCQTAGGGGVPLAAPASLVTLAALLLSSPPAIAQTSVTLVSTNGITKDLDLPFVNNDFAQAFTTGSHTFGYKLTEIQFSLRVGHQTPTVQGATAKICTPVSSSSDAPSTNCVGTLNPPTGTPVTGLNTWSAGGSGIDLQAGTSYVLVLDGGTLSSNAQTNLDFVNSTSEDPGAADGWSLADRAGRAAVGNTNFTFTPGYAIKLVLRGYAKSAPPPVTVSPDPSNLARGAVQWDPVGAMHDLPTRLGEISSNKPSEPTGSVDLTNIAASVSEEREPHSRGYYLTTQVFGLGERSHLVRAGPDGSRYVVDADGQRYEVVSPGSLLLIKIWHVHYRPDRGTNSVELLGDTFLPRVDNRLTEPVEVCVPSPVRDVERVRIAVKGRLDPRWTILDAELRDGQVCAETVRVAWLTLVYAPEPAAA